MERLASIAAAARRLGTYRFTVEAARRAANLTLALGYRAGGGRFYEKRIHDYRMLLDLRDPGVSTQLMIRGSREPEHRYILQRELKPGMTVFDLGANVGYYTIYMARLVGKAGVVYAAEPYRPSFDLLNRNLRLNQLADVAETYNVGITTADGVGELHLSARSNWHTFQPVQIARAPQWKRYARTYSRAIDVPTASLWTFLQGKRGLDFIRMDIEGYEVKVLESLVPHLSGSDFRASILFETHPEFYEAPDDMARVLRALCSRGGYTVKYLVSDGPSRRQAADAFRRRGYTERHILKYFRAYDLAIYHGIDSEDAIELISRSEQVHVALLERVGAARPASRIRH